MTKSDIIGTWRFVEMVARTASGKTLYPYGEKLFGRLMYTPDGHMSALLMDPDRDKFASDDPLAGTQEEIKQLGQAGFVKYDEMKGIHFYRKPKKFRGLQ